MLFIGTVLMISVHLLLLRRVFGPLEQLTGLMRSVDPRDPGRRLALAHADGEVVELYAAFNPMLDRLEAERRRSGRHALAAQATARGGVEDMREISRGLPPPALDELGLRSALTSLATRVRDHSGVRVLARLADDLPPLEPQHLAVYRVAQESLTNVVRHAGARTVDLVLRRADEQAIELNVRDDGAGITSADAANGGAGLEGMRERALLVGGHLMVVARKDRAAGTEVRLALPATVV